MTRRLISGDFTATHTGKVYYDPEFREYAVMFYSKDAGNALVGSYFTDDKADAIGTMKYELQWFTTHGVHHFVGERCN